MVMIFLLKVFIYLEPTDNYESTKVSSFITMPAFLGKVTSEVALTIN